MRLILTAILAMVVGAAVGAAAGWARVARYPWKGTFGGEALVLPSPQTEEGETKEHPEVFVEKDTYDFGSIDLRGGGTHDFVIKNVGRGPLILKQGETTCKCTVANLQDGLIPPGGQAKVTLEWHAKGLVGEYHQNATIHTNDPKRPKVVFHVDGRVTAFARAVPSELIMMGVGANETGRGAVRIYGYRAEKNFQIQEHHFSDKTTEAQFGVKLTPLSPQQIAEEKDAVSGYEMQIEMKPGLPVGAFQQTIVLKTNLKDLATLDVPIRGTIVSDVKVSGHGYDDEKGMLSLGVVSAKEGIERDIRIIVRGPHAKDVKFEPIEIEPSMLSVKVGKTIPMGGSVTQTLLTIGVPKGSPPGDYFGSEGGKVGRIRLKTGHPQSPEVKIFVRFVVEG